MIDQAHTLTAILPCNDLAKSRGFYQRLGFHLRADYGDYVLLADGKGAELHLRAAEEGSLTPGSSPFGLYLHSDEVDELAARFPGEILGTVGKPEDKPWRMYEFALSDPEGTLVRIGRPSALLPKPAIHNFITPLHEP